MSLCAIDRPGGGCVDALVESLGASGSGDLVAVLVRAGDPWGFRLDATRSAALVAVTQGRCFLRRPAAPAITLSAGDLLLLAGTRPGHGLSGAPDGELAPYYATFKGSTAGSTSLGATTVIDLSGADRPTSSLVYIAYEPATPARRSPADLPGLVVVEGTAHEQRGVLDETIHLLHAELVQNQPGAPSEIRRLVDVLVVHMLRASRHGRDRSDGPR